MILFLDFDGVLHPCYGSPDGAFCYLERLEDVLRDFPAVRVVLTTSWREKTPIDYLVGNFSPDVRGRIIGGTPVIIQNEPPYRPYVRHEEIKAYLKDRPAERYVILDDKAEWFPESETNLIVCNDGFFDEEEAQLRAVLEAWR